MSHSKVHTILINKNLNSMSDAFYWTMSHGFKFNKFKENNTKYYEFQQISKDWLHTHCYNHFVTKIQDTDTDIKIIIAYKENSHFCFA